MSKLTLLGAQRIKALAEMIDDQCALETASATTMTKREAFNQVMSDEELAQYDELTKIYQETIDGLNSFTHLTGNLYSSHVSTGRGSSKAQELINKSITETRGQRNEIKAKHEKRKQLLWLCETLEEAKQIVGI